MMLRAVSTLILVLLALVLAFTRRGIAVLGFARPLFIAALILLGVLQVSRIVKLYQLRSGRDAAANVPKKPLGL